MVTKRNEPIRVVVVDDSPAASDLLVSTLQSADGIEVVGVGRNGRDAIRLTKRLRPDVVTMDIIMPVMDGMEATMRIMSEVPTPIVVITATMTKVDIIPTFNALSEGALSMVKKPGLIDPEGRTEIVKTVRLMAEVPTVRLWDKKKPKSLSEQREPSPGLATEKEASKLTALVREVFEGRSPFSIKVAGIASSTGGPGILVEILKQLPGDFRVPILVVQHVTDGFSAGLADWLDGETELSVGLASHGEKIRAGTVLISPDDYHTRVTKNGTIELFKGQPYKGFRPSGNHLLSSLAETYGSQAMGIILTGMGDDGSNGLRDLHEAGGLTIAQNEQSCVVFGMPREAILLNSVDHVLSPNQIAETLMQIIAQPMKMTN